MGSKVKPVGRRARGELEDCTDKKISERVVNPSGKGLSDADMSRGVEMGYFGICKYPNGYTKPYAYYRLIEKPKSRGEGPRGRAKGAPLLPLFAQPTPAPAAQPVAQPVAQPTAQPIAQPVAQPVAQPSAQGLPVANPMRSAPVRVSTQDEGGDWMDQVQSWFQESAWPPFEENWEYWAGAGAALLATAGIVLGARKLYLRSRTISDRDIVEIFEDVDALLDAKEIDDLAKDLKPTEAELRNDGERTVKEGALKVEVPKVEPAAVAVAPQPEPKPEPKPKPEPPAAVPEAPASKGPVQPKKPTKSLDPVAPIPLVTPKEVDPELVARVVTAGMDGSGEQILPVKPESRPPVPPKPDPATTAIDGRTLDFRVQATEHSFASALPMLERNDAFCRLDEDMQESVRKLVKGLVTGGSGLHYLDEVGRLKPEWIDAIVEGERAFTGAMTMLEGHDFFIDPEQKGTMESWDRVQRNITRSVSALTRMKDVSPYVDADGQIRIEVLQGIARANAIFDASYAVTQLKGRAIDAIGSVAAATGLGERTSGELVRWGGDVARAWFGMDRWIRSGLVLQDKLDSGTVEYRQEPGHSEKLTPVSSRVSDCTFSVEQPPLSWIEIQANEQFSWAASLESAMPGFDNSDVREVHRQLFDYDWFKQMSPVERLETAKFIGEQMHEPEFVRAYMNSRGYISEEGVRGMLLRVSRGLEHQGVNLRVRDHAERSKEMRPRETISSRPPVDPARGKVK